MMAPSTVESISEWRDSLEREGRRLVFTNGCFDVLHAGHVEYLSAARALGDALVVGLNSDRSTRALKGPDRPVNSERDRATVLLGLRAVDAVVVYDDERCTRLIRAIRPHVYAKGGDYTPESLNREEKAALDQCGASIHILPLIPGMSTTATVARLRGKGTGPTGGAPTRLAVMGSGRGSNLAAILAAIERGSLRAKVVLVIADVSDAPILGIARSAGVPAVFVDPGPHPGRLGDPAQKEICDRLRTAAPDVVVLAGFMRRLKDPILSAFNGRILNVHPSRLPAFPGREAWKQALEAGVAETGVTVHVVTADIDAGPILAQQSVPVRPGDSPNALFERIQAVEHQLYPQVIAEFAARLAHPTPRCE